MQRPELEQDRDDQSNVVITCAYCGHKCVREAVQSHIEACPSHPMAALRKEISQLYADRITLLYQIGEVRSILGLKDGPVVKQLKHLDLFKAGVAAERKRIRERVGHVSHESEMPDWNLAFDAVVTIIEAGPND